jgi:hypothetical protein
MSGGNSMFARFGAPAFLCLVLSGLSFAAPIRFDFGNGAVDMGTGVAANVDIDEGTSLAGNQSATIGGTTITLQGIGPAGSVWGATSQGIGIIPEAELGMGGPRRINGTLGEFVNFSFDKDVVIDSIRLGNFTATMTNSEVVEIDFISGTDPFGGGSFMVSSTNQGPQDDIPVGVFVSGGTVLSLTASVPRENGVLWNDIVVTPIPEPGTIAMLCIAAATCAIRFRRKVVRLA